MKPRPPPTRASPARRTRSCSAVCASTARAARPACRRGPRGPTRPPRRRCAPRAVPDPVDAEGLTGREQALLALVAVLAVAAGVLHYAGAPGVTAFLAATAA